MHRLLQLGICAAWLSTLAAQPTDFSPEKIQQQVEQLKSADRAQRLAAVAALEAWAKTAPEEARKRFLDLLQHSPEPELRERSLQLLKPIAASEFGNFGEGYLGITMGTPTLINRPDEEKPCYGLSVTAVTHGSPAEKAGIRNDDIIIGVEKIRWYEPQSILAEPNGLSSSIRRIGAGKVARFLIWRDQTLHEIDATLTRRPNNLELMQMQFQPNGGFKVDEVEIQRLIEEEKNSDAYFQEWLQRALDPQPAKK
jgi:predicted metalloprotease with PDZ domain